MGGQNPHTQPINRSKLSGYAATAIFQGVKGHNLSHTVAQDSINPITHLAGRLYG